MSYLKIKLLSLAICSGLYMQAQIKNGAIFHIAGGSKIQGELLNSDTAFNVKLLDNSVYTIKKNSVNRAYLPDEIILFPDGKYNINKGIYLYSSLGIGGIDHNSFDFYGGYMLGNGFEAGVGIGFHTNSFSIPITNGNAFFSVNSYPIYLSGKYFPLKKSKLRPYAKFLAGINNNSENDSFGGIGSNIENLQSGPVIETGVGLLFSGRKRTRFFMELMQYNSYVKGTAFNFDPATNTSFPADFSIWINRIVFSFGMTIEIKG